MFLKQKLFRLESSLHTEVHKLWRICATLLKYALIFTFLTIFKQACPKECDSGRKV